MVIIEHPIHCPHCGAVVGYQEDYMFLVLTSDVLCPKCGQVVIPANPVVWGGGFSNETRRAWKWYDLIITSQYTAKVCK